MKKLAICALVLLLLTSAAACGKKPKDKYEGLSATAKLYAQRAEELNELVESKYYVPAARSAYHYYPNRTAASDGNLSTAFAWPYTEMVAAAYRIGTLSAGFADSVREYYTGLLANFEYYRAFRSDQHCYCATRSAQEGKAGGDTYYDDNIWISREFLNAYELLGEEEYLAKSKAVAEYIWSGWADDELGGIYWKEQGKTSRNACSNAPAVILFGRLYQQSKEEKYLERAKKCYDFCYDELRDDNGVYWDNVSNAGEVNTWQFTYNTGSMIAGGVKLFEITGEQRYISDAKKSAAGAYKRWFKKENGRDYPVITSDNPWFNVLLLDGFTELYKHDPSALVYIEAYEANLNYAYENLRCEVGFMPANWVNGFPKDGEEEIVIKDLNVLDMAANAENFGHLAYFYQNELGRTES